MCRSNYSVLCCLLLFLLNSTTRADWTQTNGPPGGTVRAFFTSGSKFFMGGAVNYTSTTTSSGVIFISTDDGASWREINTSITNAFIGVFVSDGAVLFAGTVGSPVSSFSGVFRSTDDGETWIAAGLPGISVYDLLVVPGSGNSTIYAGTDESVFRTTNNGEVWTLVNSGLPTIAPDRYIRTLASTPNPAGGVFLFAGTDAGVFRSTNDGATWSLSNTGMLSATGVRDLAANETGILYAATSTGPYLSTDNGLSWIRINGDLPSFTQFNTLELKSDGMGGTIIFALPGWRSTNNGANWTFVPAVPSHVLPIALGVNQSAPNGGTFYVAGHGFYKSTDNGQSWVQGNLYHSRVLDFAIIPDGVQGSRVFAGGSSVVYQTINLGGEWSHSLPIGQLNEMAVNLSSSGNPSVFVASPSGGLYRTTNNGSDWVHVSSVFNDGSVLSVLAAPDGSGGSYIVAGTFDGLWISSNNGGNWTEANNGLLNTTILSLGAIPNATGVPTLLACIFGNRVYRSTNVGVSWVEVSSGLPNFEVRSFTHSGQGTFAGTRGGGIFRSSDSGISWSAVNTGLANPTVWDLFAVPGEPGNILAATDGGVFLSTNSGDMWFSVSSGLPPSTVFAVTIAPDDAGRQYLFAGTAGRGVWKRLLSEVITSVPVASSEVPTEFRLEQNYPNPFNPSTTFTFDIGHSSFVILKAYDVLGKEVATLVNDHLKPGSYQISWNAIGPNGTSLPSGLYFYQLRAGSFVGTKKMLLLK
jgi:photosystem II stability/assembly factor-like uncharacterized protein